MRRKWHKITIAQTPSAPFPRPPQSLTPSRTIQQDEDKHRPPGSKWVASGLRRGTFRRYSGLSPSRDVASNSAQEAGPARPSRQGSALQIRGGGCRPWRARAGQAASALPTFSLQAEVAAPAREQHGEVTLYDRASETLLATYLQRTPRTTRCRSSSAGCAGLGLSPLGLLRSHSPLSMWPSKSRLPHRVCSWPLLAVAGTAVTAENRAKLQDTGAWPGVGTGWS